MTALPLNSCAAQVCPLLRSDWAREIVLGVPKERSLHNPSVLRSGRLALIGVAMTPALWLGGSPFQTGAATPMMMIVSAADDRVGQPVLARLVAQFLLAAAAVPVI